MPVTSSSASSSASAPAQKALEREGLTWLLVVVVGFFLGLGWVTGPLGWHSGRKLRRRAAELAVLTPDVVRFAHISGVVTTIVSYAALVVVVVTVVLIFGVIFLSNGRPL